MRARERSCLVFGITPHVATLASRQSWPESTLKRHVDDHDLVVANLLYSRCRRGCQLGFVRLLGDGAFAEGDGRASLLLRVVVAEAHHRHAYCSNDKESLQSVVHSCP